MPGCLFIISRYNCGLSSIENFVLVPIRNYLLTFANDSRNDFSYFNSGICGGGDNTIYKTNVI